ncbi:MAG: hypothetical protein JWO38_4906 [Gemmataceae bacterium]|nr:hypothetical protein [Gemmataceae bacterium]
MTAAEWREEGARRFGPDEMAWKWVCPACGHVASTADWKAAGAPVEAVAYSCVGRWAGARREAIDLRPFSSPKLPHGGPGPCNYSGGGLIPLNPVAVLNDHGDTIRVFEFATADQPTEGGG